MRAHTPIYKYLFVSVLKQLLVNICLLAQLFINRARGAVSINIAMFVWMCACVCLHARHVVCCSCCYK